MNPDNEPDFVPREVPGARLCARLRSLLPEGRPRTSRKPRPRAEKAAVLLLLLLFAAWFAAWMRGSWGMLTDTNLQTDDARTALFVFHRYDSDPSLVNDPVAEEMIGFTPPALRLVYAALVRTIGLFCAMKVVQASAFLMILWAAIHVARRRRGGPAAAVLLAFLTFHSRSLMSGTIGGMTRGFVVPVFSLWTAGVLTRSRRMRYLAVLIAAATHPASMAILIAAEGALAFEAGFGTRSWRITRRRIAQFAALFCICLAFAVPYSLDQSRRVGRPFTIEEAEREGMLGPNGRAQHLPLGDPTSNAAKRLVSVFAIDDIKDAKDPALVAGRPFPAAVRTWRDLENTGPLVVIAVMMGLAAMRLGPLPREILALIAATFVTYYLSRIFAFRMYAPQRYYQYGMPYVTLIAAVGVFGRLGPKLPRGARAILRSAAALIVMLASIAFTGDGIVPRNGVSLDRRADAELFDFVRTLPEDIRIAAHPNDADDIPLWCGRSTVVGFETMQPWWVGHWFRAKRRAEDTLSALYAVDRAAVLSYCENYGVTHLLVRGDRYRDDFKKKARMFEPIGAWIDAKLATVERKSLVLGDVPESAVIFRMRSYRLIDVKLLRTEWSR